MNDQILYLVINLCVIAVPLALSFEKRLKFYQIWKAVIPSIIITAGFFLVWDVYFTHLGYWGFNDKYLLPIRFLGLPISEWLFFITVPYACVFIYASLKVYFLTWINSLNWQYTLYLIILFAGILAFTNTTKPYTLSACVLAIVIAVWMIYQKKAYLKLFCFAFLVSIIPFVLVNGILTGTLIEEQIVWYNSDAFSGLRLGTIPLEDFFYSFDLIAINIILSEYFLARNKSKQVFNVKSKVNSKHLEQ